MKKLLVSLVGLGLLALPASSFALSAHYRSVYCYPGGTYWQAQITRFPGYYSAHNAYYLAHYGPGTYYC